MSSYYERNKDKIMLYQKEYYINNINNIRNYQKKYYNVVRRKKCKHSTKYGNTSNLSVVIVNGKIYLYF